MLSQYSNCNWTATGQLECDQTPMEGFQRSHNPTTDYHSRTPPEGYHPSDSYSGLNRELAVSVYSPTPPDLRPSMSPQLRPSQQAGSSPQVPTYAQLWSEAQQEIPSPSTSSPSATISSQIVWNQIPKNYTKFKKTVNSYYFQTPFQKYHDLVGELGPPTVLNPNQCGMASWYRPGQMNPDYQIFDRIDILDEQCFNRFPYPHNGFLYTYVKIKIPLSILNKVLSISGDISYDPIKHLLVVRGMSINYNIAIISIICQFVSGKITWYNIIEYDLIKQQTHHKRLTNPKIQKRNLREVSNLLKK